MRTPDSQQPLAAATAARSLRLAAVVGVIGIACAAVWGLYILLALSMGGYVVGRHRTLDSLNVLPPLGLGAILVAAALVALRGARASPRTVTRGLLAALVVVEGAIGLSLFGYATWSGSRVARAHIARASHGAGSSHRADRTTIVLTPRRPTGSADSTAADDIPSTPSPR